MTAYTWFSFRQTALILVDYRFYLNIGRERTGADILWLFKNPRATQNLFPRRCLVTVLVKRDFLEEPLPMTNLSTLKLEETP